MAPSRSVGVCVFPLDKKANLFELRGRNTHNIIAPAFGHFMFSVPRWGGTFWSVFGRVCSVQYDEV